MSTMVSRLALRGLVLGVALGAVPAFAADAKQIADAIVAVVGAGGESTATYDSATASGDDVTITNLKIVGDGDTATFPTAVIVGAVPRDKGGFTATSMSFDNASFTGKDATTAKWQTASVQNAIVPSPDEIKAKAKITPFTDLTVAGINISGGDLPTPLDIGTIAMKLGGATDSGAPSEFTMTIGEFKLPAELFAADAQSKQVLDALGYTSGFTLNIDVDGGYDSAGDALTLRTIGVDAVDVGKLTIGGKFSGIPLSQMTDDADFKDGKLDSFSLRFDNAGIVERALDMQAKMMGGTREEVVTQLSQAMPFMLNAIGNEPFQNKLAAAGAAFLKDPKSITIVAAPSAPVPFAQIGSTVETAPQTIPDLLAVDVQANN